MLFFGLARDLTGTAEETADITEGERLEDVWTRTLQSFPRLKEISGSLLLAVNQSVAPRSLVLADGDEVAFLPPVSGGEGSDFCRITPEEISAAALVEGMKGPGDGAIATFEGTVRDNSSGRKTLYLEYEAYTPMAAREMEAIAREAKRKFSVSGVRITHRTGRLAIGETSVAIAVTSAHRAAA
ncbi:MAG: molybdenum cofactor biosynthesis protein MoaE, partial [Acidobacteriota bacterium]|nr:molybdenum cofactor biosynthesis protein MoaE [Acidobacteriota bacterium]